MKKRVWGVFAEFKDVDTLKHACEQVRDAGYRKWDAHSPFPVHGIDPAMGIRPTILPWIVLVMGMTGLAVAIAMQYWMNAVDYPFRISGKPMFSLPANIPIAFELTVLFSVLGTIGSVFALNRIPEHYHPLFSSERFKIATSHGFFISLEATDPKFSLERAQALLSSIGGENVEVVEEVSTGFPVWVRVAIATGILVTLIPMGLAVRARYVHSKEPRIHIIPDLDFQPKYKTQRAHPLFTDGRSMRLPVEGTVARGDLRADLHFYEGKVGDQYVTAFPEQLSLDAQTMARGQERFGIYCTPCHGVSGRGNGVVALRAESLQEGTWVPPTDLTSQPVQVQPVGQIFHSITYGVRNMRPYGAQITEADRWAIVLYVKALQKTQLADAGEATP